MVRTPHLVYQTPGKTNATNTPRFPPQPPRFRPWCMFPCSSNASVKPASSQLRVIFSVFCTYHLYPRKCLPVQFLQSNLRSPAFVKPQANYFLFSPCSRCKTFISLLSSHQFALATAVQVDYRATVFLSYLPSFSSSA